MYGYWEKLDKETENTHRWAKMTITEGATFTAGPAGPGSNEVLNGLVALPFRLTFLLLRLVVRVLSRGLKIWK